MNARLMTALLIGVSATFFIIGSVTAEKDTSLNKTTLENLSTAMRGEAFAHAKYLLYAEKARQGGDSRLAGVFETAAREERLEHFAEEARLAGTVGSDVHNLKDAIQGESYEVDTMYRTFAEQAAAAGDRQAASLFEEIRRDEMKHRDALKAELARLERTSARR